jgi:hypothetical protein
LVFSLTLFLFLFLFLFLTWLQTAAKKSGGKSKKPLSGFMLFSKEHRAKIKEDQPDLTFGGIGKKLGELWRALTDKEKEDYKSRKGWKTNYRG